MVATSSFAQEVEADDIMLFYRWFGIVRILVGSVLGGIMAFLWYTGSLASDPLPLIVFIVLGYSLLTALWMVMIHFRVQPKLFLYVQMITDLMVITMAILASGDIRTEFILFYAPIVLSAAVISFSSTMVVSLGAAGLSAALVYNDTAFIPLHFPQIFANEDFTRVIILAVFMIAIAFQNYYFISRIRKRDKALLDLKDDFLFHTVHDLRSPATSIKWFIAKYEDSDLLKQHPELAADFASLHELNGRMQELIEELLRLAKDKGKTTAFVQESVDLVPLFSGTIMELKPTLEAKRVQVEWKPKDARILVIGNHQSLKEVFANLLDNAVKYNREGGKIFIDCAKRRGEWEVRIRDTGIGISSAEQEQLFTPYFRAKNVGGAPGTGLGLYIVKRLVRKMGGRISVSSSLNKGTEFSIILPVAQEG